MDSQAILAALSDKFGDAISASPANPVGDPFIVVAAEQFHAAVEFLKDDAALAMDQLKLITGVDRGEWMESVYHLYSYTHFHGVTLKVKLDRKQPEVASLVDLYGAADWHERESYDMTGIRYVGHPNLRRILLPEDWEGHPLRIDYQAPEQYHGIPNAPAEF